MAQEIKSKFLCLAFQGISKPQVKPQVKSQNHHNKNSPQTKTKFKPGVVVYTPEILLLWELRQKNPKFEASVGNTDPAFFLKKKNLNPN